MRPVPDATGMTGAALSCTHCARLLTATWLTDAVARSKGDGVKLPFPLATFLQVCATSERRRVAGNAGKLAALNLSRRLASSHARLNPNPNPNPACAFRRRH